MFAGILGPLSFLVFAGIVLLFRTILDPRRSLPGPFFARFTRWWLVRHAYRGHAEQEEIELHKKYGPIVRLAPNMYSFSEPSAAKAIYEHGGKYIKSTFYEPFGTPSGEHANIFQDQKIDRHAVSRRRVAALYSMTSIVSYEPFVDDNMQTYLGRLDQFARESRVIDLPLWMQFYAFDVIGAITIGAPYGFLEQGWDFPGIIRELEDSQFYSTLVGSYSGPLHQYIAAAMSIFRKIPLGAAALRYAIESMDMKQRDIENGKSIQETPGKQDFAEKLLSLKSRGKVDDNDISSTLQSNVGAGSETTGITLSAVMYYLMHNPAIMAKLREEVDEHASKQSGDGFTTFAQAREMPYLQAVIKEALRMHPAVGMPLPRVVPEGGATLSGHFFPTGTVVGVNAWVLHRQTALFGPDADRFRPERWLEGDLQSKGLENALFSFGGGSRTCIGKNISLLEIQKLVPELVKRYDFEFVNGKKEWECHTRFVVKQKFDVLVKMRAVK